MIANHKWLTKNEVVWVLVLVASTLFFGQSKSWGEVATMGEARQASQNWLRYMVFQRGNWAGEARPQLMKGQEIIERDTLLGYYFPVSPSGYIAVPVLKELPPIKAYSDKYQLDIRETEGFPALLKEVLAHRLRLYARIYGTLDAVQPQTGDVLLGRGHKAEWNRFLKSTGEFETDLNRGRLEALTEVGPLLTTDWDQGTPYNSLCPEGDLSCTDCCPYDPWQVCPPTFPSLVGCLATASAQIMKYHNWPPYGKGSHSYTWDGDDSCDGPVGGGTLEATFSDPYDWQNMPDDCASGCSQAEQDALAELCHEVGVAFHMDYGVCGSGAYVSSALTGFPTYFRYDSAIDQEDRDDHSAVEWFSIIQTEINNDRPTQYVIYSHSIVCDGWRDTGGQNQYHMNYGWGGGYTGWYAVDSLFCPWPDCDPMLEYMIRYIQPGYKSLICGDIYDGSGGPLTPAGSPYLVTCDVVVPSGETLTIQPGAEVHFESGFGIIADGTLNANGESGNPIELFSENTPHRGLKLQTDLRLENGAYFKPSN